MVYFFTLEEQIHLYFKHFFFFLIIRKGTSMTMSIPLNFLYSVIMCPGFEHICLSIQISCPRLLSADMFARDDGIGSEWLCLYHDSVCELFWPANSQNLLIDIRMLILKRDLK